MHHHRPSRARLAVATVAGAAALTVGAAASQQPSFRSEAQTVAVYATVTNREGRLVTELRQADFEIYDEGRLRPITLFKSDVQPVTVVVMLDTSGSMTLNLERLKNAAERFVLRLLPDDRARIGSFSDRILLSPAFTGDRDELVRVLREDIRFGNPTFLWDAIDASMTALAPEPGRRVVLVFTDGADETSRQTDFRRVLERAQAEDFMIYAIGMRGRVLRMVTEPDRRLRELAERTGGGYFYLRDTADLDSTFTRIADELHRQYVLGFAVGALDGRLHELEVKTTRPGTTVRARRSYLAVRPGQAVDPPPARPLRSP